TLALQQADADLIVMPQTAPDRPRLVLCNIGEGPLNQRWPQVGRLRRGHQAKGMRTASAARYQAHPSHHLHPLDDESGLAGTTRDPAAPRAGLEAASPFGEVGGFHRR